jgi:thioredoxin 1
MAKSQLIDLSLSAKLPGYLGVSMATTEITDDNFRQIYQDNEIVVLDFWASWCGPCLSYAPIYEKVSEQTEGVVFGKVDTEAQPKLSEYFAIRSIPTTIIIREQLELFRHSGLVPEDALKDVIQKIKAADMEEVRKKIEAEDSQA